MITQINELVLRIPGISREQGASLGNEVAELVVANLPRVTGDYEIPELKIKMSSRMSDPSSMASSIADQIVRQVKLSIYNT